MRGQKRSVRYGSIVAMTDSDDTRASRARELRRAGLTLVQIKAELGLRSNSQLVRWLQGIPAPAWTKRPRAKDAQRDRALQLRALGWTHRGIAAELGVAKSSVSNWLQDEAAKQRPRESRLARRRRVGIERQMEKLDAARSVGSLTDRELLLVGVVAYWAEGSKSKPWNPLEGLRFTNSDPSMIRLFLRWLDLLGVDPHRLCFTVHIHDSADVVGAERYWADVVGLPAGRFRKTVLKRHAPRTNRKNTGRQYHGCLRVYVRMSAQLYRRMEGLWGGIVDGSRPERRSVAGFPALASCPEDPWTLRRVPRSRIV